MNGVNPCHFGTGSPHIERADHDQRQKQQERDQKTKAREAESLCDGKLPDGKACGVNRKQESEVRPYIRRPRHRSHIHNQNSHLLLVARAGVVHMAAILSNNLMM
jgi:hypothetical protein